MSGTKERMSEALPRNARRATSAMFVVLGMLVGTIAARVPAIKAHADLSEGELGAALLGLPLGTIIAMQAAGRLISQYGSRPVVVLGGLALPLSLLSVPVAANLPSLLIAFAAVGTAMGFLDVSMNAHAVVVEQMYRRSIMSAFHAFFSAGALTGALAGAGAAGVDMSTAWHFGLAAATSAAVVLLFRPGLLPGSVDAHAAEDLAKGLHKVRWTKPVILLGTIAFCSFVGEGAAADWSAVYLDERLGASSAVAACGYAMTSLAMMGLRFIGDRITDRLGPLWQLRAGGTLAAVGLTFGLATENVWLSIAGWGVMGLGLACVAPVAFTAAGNLPGVPHGVGLARVAGLGYLGVLVGPPIIGGIAELTTLRTALFVPAALALLVALTAKLALRDVAGDRSDRLA